jgi:hypothetical protein
MYIPKIESKAGSDIFYEAIHDAMCSSRTDCSTAGHCGDCCSH